MGSHTVEITDLELSINVSVYVLYILQQWHYSSFTVLISHTQYKDGTIQNFLKTFQLPDNFKYKNHCIINTTLCIFCVSCLSITRWSNL
jgi:hypothetical protein